MVAYAWKQSKAKFMLFVDFECVFPSPRILSMKKQWEFDGLVWFVLFVLICAKLLFCLFEKKSSCQLLFISIVCDKIKQQFQKSSTTAIQKRFISWLLLRQQHIDKRPENRFYIWPNHFWNGYLICFDGMWKYLKIMFEKTFVFV